MTRDKLAFVALFFAVLFGGVAITGFVKSAVAAEVAAEAGAESSRFQLVEESKFGANVHITIFRVRNPRRYGDVMFEYCVVTSPGAPATILYKEIVP